MSTAVFMFEGEMERRAIPRLLGPVFHNADVKVTWSKRYHGRGDLLRKLPRVVRVECDSASDTHVFALIDYHPRHPRWSTLQGFKKGVAQSVDGPLRRLVHVHLAVHDIESWILCDREALVRKLGVDEKSISNEPEKIDLENPPKTVVRRLFRNNKAEYRETTEGVELLAGLNIARVYERCRYFRELLDDISHTFQIDLSPMLDRTE